jgi:hypothetical protein
VNRTENSVAQATELPGNDKLSGFWKTFDNLICLYTRRKPLWCEQSRLHTRYSLLQLTIISYGSEQCFDEAERDTENSHDQGIQRLHLEDNFCSAISGLVEVYPDSNRFDCLDSLSLDHQRTDPALKSKRLDLPRHWGKGNMHLTESEIKKQSLMLFSKTSLPPS